MFWLYIYRLVSYSCDACVIFKRKKMWKSSLRLSRKNFVNVYCCPNFFWPFLDIVYEKKLITAAKKIKPTNHGFIFENKKKLNWTEISSSVLCSFLGKNQSEKIKPTSKSWFIYMTSKLSTLIISNSAYFLQIWYIYRDLKIERPDCKSRIVKWTIYII